MSSPRSYVLNPRWQQCDLKVPQCTTCAKQNEECNITKCVAYSHDSVELLLGELRKLQACVDQAQHVPDRPHPSVMTEQQVRNEADELGVLAIGGHKRADLRASYGKSIPLSLLGPCPTMIGDAS